MATTCNDLTLLAHTPQPDLLARVKTRLATWRERWNSRAELAMWQDRDLRDAGLTRYDLQMELRKPFWRA